MKFIYGEISTEFPKEFTPPEMWPEYAFITDVAAPCKREIVLEKPAALRWSLWPLTFEQYFGDEEPNYTLANDGELAYNRMILWRPLRSRTTPHGWHKGFGVYRVDGYQKLDDGDFTTRWNKNARRDLRLWKEQHLNNGYRIEEISEEEYAAAYKTSLISAREGNDRLDNLQNKLLNQYARQHAKLWGIRNKEGKVVAGTAAFFSPTYKSSTHFAPFILEEARHIYAATALVHHWFIESRKAECNVVMTTNFWHTGKPKGWKGFSEFKSHFGWQYVAYPPLLWRFVRGKLW